MSSSEPKNRGIMARLGAFLLGAICIVLGSTGGSTTGGAGLFGVGIALVALSIFRKIKVALFALLIGFAAAMFVTPYMANLLP